jgi:hypothetical protein
MRNQRSTAVYSAYACLSWAISSFFIFSIGFQDPQRVCLRQVARALGSAARRLGLETGEETRRGAGVESGTPTDTEAREGADVSEWARRESNARPLAPEAGEASAGRRTSALASSEPQEEHSEPLTSTHQGWAVWHSFDTGDRTIRARSMKGPARLRRCSGCQ